MGPNPLAPLSQIERANYRTAVTGHVVEAMYRSWQQRRTLSSGAITSSVQAMCPDTPAVEIHRAIGRLECAGKVRQSIGTSQIPRGDWELVTDSCTPPLPAHACKTRGCLRLADHELEHLPDLHGERLTVQMVIHHDDFVAAWSQGSPWVLVYASETDWATRAEPRDVLIVPHNLGYTTDGFTALVTEWLGRDEYHLDAKPPSHRDSFVYVAGVDNGVLVEEHPDFTAVWDHDAAGYVVFYRDTVAWGRRDEPIGHVDVPHGSPFTGAVLGQLAEDWHERTREHAHTRTESPETTP